MRATVRSKGQITLVAARRDRMGIDTGTVREVRQEGERIVLAKADAGDTVSAVFGRLADGRTTDALMASLRLESEDR